MKLTSCDFDGKLAEMNRIWTHGIGTQVAYGRHVCYLDSFAEDLEKHSLNVLPCGYRFHPLTSVDPGCGIVDVLLQLSIYVALDIMPLVRFMIVYFSTGPGQLGQARAKREKMFSERTAIWLCEPRCSKQFRKLHNHHN